MPTLSPKDKIRYRFDKLMSRGTVILVIGLFLLSTILILVMSIAAYLSRIVPASNGHSPTLIDILWMSLMRTLDGGTMGNDTGSWPFLLCMLFITSAGILFISTLTGILTNGIQRKMEVMRKGRSHVDERDHFVILGWSSQIFPILNELIYANRHDPGFCVVMLADKDKVEMEDEIHLKLKKHKHANLVCRSGDPLDLHALEIVNLQESRAIIILTPENSQDPDSDVIKTILAITNNPERRDHPYHIVAAVRSNKNLSVARMVGQQEIEVVLTNSLIARLTVQTCRQPGLSVVYQEILDFRGNNIHFKDVPELTGKSFRESVFAFESSAVIGLRRKDGRILISPHEDTVLTADDKIVVLSLGPENIVPTGKKGIPLDPTALAPLQPRPKAPEKTLILGWNHNTTTVVNELDAYVSSGSQVHVIADLPECEVEILRNCCRLQHLRCTFEQADTTDRDVLERVHAENYDYIMTMAYSNHLDTQQADAKTLLTLLHLRDLSNRMHQSFSISSEMLDARNRDLAQIAQVNDFIVSDKFISLMMAQLADNKELNQIFEELLSPEGVEIYLKPAIDYIRLDHPVNFYTVLEAACERKELAIGYKIKALEKDPQQNHGIRLNPDKSAFITFSKGDRIIVIAED